MRLTLGLLLFSALTLTAGCSGDSAIDGAKGQPNSFAGEKNPANDFTPGSTGDSGDNSGLAANEVRVTMELPGGLAPDGEPTRRNLRIVKPDTVRVYQTNRNLQVLGAPEYTTREDSNGVTVIAFENGQPLAPDVVIEAQYGNAVLRALAADADRDIKVNPFSEYLVRNTLPQYSASEFQRILDCADETSDSLCINKYVWPALADQVHDFEIDIPTGASIAGALDLLAQRADFASYVVSAANYPLLDNQSSDSISASSAEYNSVFMGIELGQTFLESSLTGSGQWGIRMGREESTSPSTETAYTYPGLTLASLDVFDINVTSLASQIPYDRKTLIHKQGNEFFTRGTDTWALNTHSTSPGGATLDRDTRLLAVRALYQSITGRNSSRTIGWTRNPYFLDAYVGETGGDNIGPDRALAGYFSAGKAIQLESENGKLARKETLETQYVSALQLNLLRREGFDANTLNGRDYNLVYFATRFSESTTPLQVESGNGLWQVRANGDHSDITQTQTYSTLNRDSSGAVLVGGTGSRSDNWIITPRPARLSTGDKNIGRLNLDVNNPAGAFGQPDLGVGASVPDGSLMAFNLVNAASSSGIIGDGLLIVAERRPAPAPQSGRYRVQGFAMGIEDGLNRLIHLNDGTLNLSGSTASLNSNTLNVVHSVDNAAVAAPSSGQLSTTLEYTDKGDGEVSFTAGDLSLTGFVTADQTQFFLLFRNTVNGEEQRGLLMATKLP
ncbi:hypothetical protein [Marinobacter salexigens]|uniref:Uncharacterized protein n=1 Tax=Marinobacter salexigens TaxID=1925763 RepID=A0ABS6AC49_9GAMM|nr:hypothetical protein [Marinobacter salexigens]MBU2874777.1 hypothetical protein [Marinobacter salexigens]